MSKRTWIWMILLILGLSIGVVSTAAGEFFIGAADGHEGKCYEK